MVLVKPHLLELNERRWCKLDNVVGFMAIVEKVYERVERWWWNIHCHHHNSFVCLLDLAGLRSRSLKRPLFALKGDDVMSAFGIVVLLCLVLAFIELHR